MAAKFRIKIDQGATYRKPFTWKAGGVPVDLTGYTARMHIRTEIDSDIVLHELTTENDGIQINPLLGEISIHIPHGITSAFNFETAVYDLELVDPTDEVIRFIEGDVLLSREVTREQ
ncbi:MAG: hypothetical protein RSA84_09370 [Acinetobacter sp.]